MKTNFHVFFSVELRFGSKIMAALFSLPVGHDSDGEESEPDLFQCGKCKQMFTSLQKYLKHKAAKDCSVHLQGSRTVVSPVTNGEVPSGEGLGESTSFPGVSLVRPGLGTRLGTNSIRQQNFAYSRSSQALSGALIT